MKQNVSIEFLGLPVGEKYTFAMGVINGLTANADVFLNPPVPVANLTTINSDYAAALSAANGAVNLLKRLLKTQKLHGRLLLKPLPVM